VQLFRPQRVRHIHGRISEYCNDPLQGGHILAHFKVDVIKQPLDNNFDKTSAQIQVGLNNPKPYPAPLGKQASIIDGKIS